MNHNLSILSALTDAEVVWDDISQFEPVIIGPEKVGGMAFLDNVVKDKIAMQRIETSDIAYEEMREYYSNQWSYTTGHPMIRMSTITWRDYNKGFVYNKFKKAMKLLETAYPEEAYWDISVKIIPYNRFDPIEGMVDQLVGQFAEQVSGSLANTLGFGSDEDEEEEIPFFQTKDAILIKISSVTFDQNADGEFLQFSTTFMHSGEFDINPNGGSEKHWSETTTMNTSRYSDDIYKV